MRPDVKNPQAIFSGFQEFHHSKEKKDDLFEFWFNYHKGHKILGEGVLNEDWKDAYDNGWVFHTDIPYNQLCAAIFWTRWPSEFTLRTKAMKMLVESGTHPDIAFLVSTVMTYKDGGGLSESCASGHMPCASHLQGNIVGNFLRGTPITKEVKTYEKKPTYTSIDGVFSNNSGYIGGGLAGIKDPLGEKLVSILRRHAGGGWKKGPDIFMTEDFHNQLRALAGDGLEISVGGMADLAKDLNKFREEVIA